MGEDRTQDIRTALRNGDVYTADEFLRDVEPHTSDLAVLTGIRAATRGEFARARELIDALPAAEDLEPVTRADLALARMLLGEVDAAAAILEPMSAERSLDGYGWARLAAARATLEDYNGAKAAYQEATYYLPEKPEVPLNIGAVLVRENRFEEALAYYERALQMKPDLEKAAQARRELLSAMDRHEEVMAEYQARIEADPADLAARRALAQLYDEADQPQQAVETLRDASEQAPDEPAIYADLAQLFLGRGRFQKAIAAARRAEQAADPEDIGYKLLTARALMECQRLDQARTKIDEVREIQPDNLQVQLIEASINAEQGDYSTAETTLRNLAEKFPGHPGIQTQFGFTRLWLGQIDEAIECFEIASRLNPMALANMVQARKLPEDDATLRRMESFADNKLMASAPRAAMAFALASVYDKQKQPERGFTYLEQANELGRNGVMHSPTRFTREVNTLKTVYTPDLFERFSEAGHGATRPVFVCGMPRSGTTLTEQILSSHQDVFGAGELGIVPHITALMRKVLKTETVYPTCMTEAAPWVIRAAARHYLRKIARLDDEHAFVVDKLPHNFAHLGLIAMMFPNARITHLRRDVRDVALSNYFQNYRARFGGMAFAYRLEDIAHEIVDHERLMEHWRSVLPIEMLDLDYEWLIQDQQTASEALLGFLGVSWDARVTEFYKTERAVRTASVWQVRQPIYATSQQRWRRYESYLEPLERVFAERRDELADPSVLDKPEVQDAVQ